MKIALADVLWTAANEHLWDGGYYAPQDDRSRWSCNAVIFTTGSAHKHYRKLPAEIKQFLGSLGCRCGYENYSFGTKSDVDRQGARYMWLLLAAKVAEDEQIMIEVAK